MGLVLVCVVSAEAQPIAKSAFTYQGNLQDGGQPANANYDMQFSLWTAPVGGARVAGPVQVLNVTVSNGMFTVQVDFGGQVLMCEADWLEIEVKPAGNPPPYTLLVPRQELTPTPFAICAQTVPWSGIMGIPGGFADGVDDDTTYSAGSGLELLGTTFSIASGGVTSTMLSDNSVTTAKISAGSVTNAKLAAAAVDTNNLVDGAVTNAKLAGGAVTEAKIANNAVTFGKLADGAVISSKIAADAVTGTKLADGSVSTASLLSLSVTTEKLANSVVTNAKLAGASVTTGKISSSGASSDKAIMYNGSNVTWGYPKASSLDLPYSASKSTAEVLALTNTRDPGTAIYAKSTGGFVMHAEAKEGVTAGSGYAFRGTHVDDGNWCQLASTEYGVLGVAANSNDYGVKGANLMAPSSGYIGGANNGVYGSGTTGVYGDGTGFGVYGDGGVTGIGVYGKADNWAGWFNGKMWVQGHTTMNNTLLVLGAIFKAGGGFKIDHPLDPANKWLYHSYVESPDMKNVYDGVVELDAGGQATVTLPAWFEALNKDFRYQLTAIGMPAPNLHILQEVTSNQIIIAGGNPFQRVSWQVTGIRQDDWANANRVPEEEPKTP